MPTNIRPMRITAALGPALAVLLLGWAFHRVDLPTFQGALRGAVLPPLLLALALKLVVVGLKGLRLRLALGPRAAEPRHVVIATFIGAGANAAVPARLGEVARAVVLLRRAGVPFAQTVASALVTQLLDLLLLGAAASCLLLLGVGGRLASGSIVLALLCAALVPLGMLVALGRGWLGAPALRRLAARVVPARLLAGLQQVAGEVARGCGCLGRPGTLAGLSLLTLLLWALEAWAVGLSLLAFGIEPAAATVATVLTFLNLAVAVPLTPANLGTHQVLSIALLGLFAVSPARALAYSIAFSTATTLTMALIGAALFTREGMSVPELRRTRLSEAR